METPRRARGTYCRGDVRRAPRRGDTSRHQTSNVLVDQRGHPYLLDFGIARDLNADHGLTATEEAVGTPAFMAPEQAQNSADQIGPGCDIWSLGVLMYYLATDHLPFVGNTVYQIYEEILYQRPKRPRSYRQDLPVALERIIQACLHKEIEQRYLSAADLADDLHRFARGESVRARRWVSLNKLFVKTDVIILVVAIVLTVIGLLLSAGSKIVFLLAIVVLLGSHLWWWRSRSHHQRDRFDLAQRRMREQVKADAPAAKREIQWHDTPLWSKADGLSDWLISGGRATIDGQGIRLHGGRPLLAMSPFCKAGDQRIDVTLEAVQPGERWGIVFAAISDQPNSGYGLVYDRQRSQLALFRAGLRMWQQAIKPENWQGKNNVL